MMNMQIRTLLSILLLCFTFSSMFARQDIDDEFVHLETEVGNLSVINKQKAIACIDKMYSLANQSPDSSLFIARTLYSEASLHYRQNIIDSTLYDKINKGLENVKTPSLEEDLLYCALGNYLLIKEDYSAAFEAFNMANEKAALLNDSLTLTASLNMMGIICDKVRLVDLSEDYYTQALKWAKKNSIIYYSIKNNLFNYQLLREKPDSLFVVESLSNLIEEVKEQEKTGILLILYINAGNFWSDMGDHEKSISFLKMANDLCEDNPQIKSLILHNMGYYYMENKKYKEALNHFMQSLKIQEEYPNSFSISHICRNISYIYEQTNQPDSALLFLRQSLSFDEANNKRSLIMETHRQRLMSSLEQAENSLKESQSEIKLKNKQFSLILISVVGFIIVALLLMIIFLQKRNAMKQQLKLQEAEKNELSLQLEKEQMQQKAQASELENKLREVTSYSLLLSNKNQILHQIKQVCDQLPDSEKTIKRQIKGIVKDNLHIENDWNDFMLHFNDVHPDYFERLNALCPQLTQLEQKLAAYIRLNLSTSQISQMLNVTPESIRSNRYRLRKKLGLDKNENIDNFLQSI